MKETKEQNSTHKKLNANKGITLIALIITIIVMLILVAVTINMAVNGGLFGYAGKATGETQNAINVEQELANGKVQIGGVWYDSIDDYISGTPHKWTRSGDTFTCSHCSASYEMGELVKYTATGTSTMFLDRLGLTGVDPNERTIESQDTTWIVLGIEDTNKDGVYETLLLTSKTSLPVLNSAGLPLNGAEAYNNGPDEINRICKELYSNSEYGEARGMTIEDVNNVFNYTPDVAIYYDGTSTQEIEGLTTRLDELPTELWNTIKASGTLTPNLNDEDTEADLGAYELNGYWYETDGEDGLTLANSNIKTITEVERDTVFDIDYPYWLASRGVGAEEGMVLFGIGAVLPNRVTSAWSFFNSIEGSVAGQAFYLRPVIEIKNKLPESMVVEPENIDDWTYTVEEDGTITINRYSGDDTVVTIPNYINGIPVKRIEGNEGVSTTSTESDSLWDTSICGDTVVSVVHSRTQPVQDTITKVVIPEGITEIGNDTFLGSIALVEISLPESLTRIGSLAFGECGNLTTIKFPSNLKTIGEYAFWATGLQGNIILPGGLETVGYYAFTISASRLTLSVPWKEGEKPEGWDDNWYYGDNITIKYAE